MIEQCPDFESAIRKEQINASADAFNGKHRKPGIGTLPVNKKTYKKMKKVLSLLTIFRSKVFPDEQMSAMLSRFVENRARLPRLRAGRLDGICRNYAAKL
jgi:hypothetical protein